jgi:hypothetical protein
MKGTTIFLLIFLISISTASPILEFQHDETQQGETILATIKTTGEFTKQIEPSDITFLEGRKKIFFESDITFYDDTHYLYIYTTRPGNFTIKIKEILYTEAEELKSSTIEKQFIINPPSNETQALSIKPGFVITTELPQIKLINKGTSTLNITYNENTISLEPQAFQKITFQPTETFSLLEISTYKTFSIPIIYPVANTSFEPPTIQLDLKQDPELLFAELTTDTTAQETIQLFNFGDENITITKITSNLSFIEIESPKTIQPRKIQNLTITISPKNSGHFQNPINITYTQYNETKTLQIPVSLFILPKGSTEEDFEITEETCAGQGGVICSNEETCDNKSFFATDGYCCQGTCQPIKEDETKGSSYKWIIAIIIFIILAAAGYYFYKRQKRITPKKPEEQIKETSDKFTKRLTGNPESSRTTGKLSKT